MRSLDSVNVWPMLTGEVATRPTGGRFIVTTEASVIDTQTGFKLVTLAGSVNNNVFVSSLVEEKSTSFSQENCSMHSTNDKTKPYAMYVCLRQAIAILPVESDRD